VLCIGHSSGEGVDLRVGAGRRVSAEQQDQRAQRLGTRAGLARRVAGLGRLGPGVGLLFLVSSRSASAARAAARAVSRVGGVSVSSRVTRLRRVVGVYWATSFAASLTSTSASLSAPDNRVTAASAAVMAAPRSRRS
jgi:hypothetical protein